MITVIHQVIWPVQLQLDRKGFESEGDVEDEPGKRRFRVLTFVKSLQHPLSTLYKARCQAPASLPLVSSGEMMPHQIW